jgi:hypothetical protein
MSGHARCLEELVLDELTDQFDCTRCLLTGGATPLTAPDRFDQGKRLVMKSLEVLDRDGFRDLSVVTIGPLRALARPAVECIAKYIVRSFTRRVVDELATPLLLA